MKAEEKALKFLTMEGKVKIPFFQRTYVWDLDNWEDLLNELLNTERKNTFLGTIILKQLPSTTGEPKQLEVIDGQQRLTTLSILLKALYDAFEPDTQKNIKNEIYNILFYKRDYTSSDYDEVRIENSLVDSEYFKKILTQSESINLKDINDNDHRLLRCYKFFRENFDKLSPTEKSMLLNKILNTENKMLVVIDLNESDDEQTIFDTLNTAGVRLTSAEIIKNAIFKRFIDLSSKDKAIEIYRSTWQATFYKDEDTIKFWEAEVTTGRLKRQNIEILLHSIGVIENFYDPIKHNLSDLSRLYKEEINKFNTSDELRMFIDNIIEYANIYKRNFYNFNHSDTFIYANDIENIKKRLFHILQVIEISSLYPFILFILKNYSNNESKLRDYLKKLESFVILNQVSKIISTKSYNKLCKQFIENPERLNEEIQKIKSEDIENGLNKIHNFLASLILFWTELYIRSQSGKHDKDELKYVYSLEHIMPQRWEEHWSFDKVPHPNKSLSLEQAQIDRNQKVQAIGNMTLLKSKLNSSLKNCDFKTKIEGDGKKKGMRHYSDLIITKMIIEQFDKGDKVWDEFKIEDRTKFLLKYFLEIWGSNNVQTG